MSTDENLLNEIEQRVREAIKAAMERAYQIDPVLSRPWTKEIKQTLTTLGRELGYDVRGVPKPDRRDDFEAEWLWDLSWAEVRNRMLIHLPLIVESEWNSEGDTSFETEVLWKDFQKLIVGRAALRVMIFSTRETETCFERLIDATRPASQPGDRYLLAAWDNRDKTPRFRSFTACLASNERNRKSEHLTLLRRVLAKISSVLAKISSSRAFHKG